MASPVDVGEVVAVRPDLSILEQYVTAEAGEKIDYVAMLRESWIRGSPDSRTISFGRTVGL